MEIGHGVDHGVVDAAPVFRRNAGQRAVPQAAAIGQPHDEEFGAEHIGVFAQAIGLRHREAGGAERRHRGVFAVDRVGRWQQLAEGLATQDIAARRCVDPVGRVRLAALELRIGNRPGEIGDIGFEPRRQRVNIKPVAFFHRDRAHHFLVEINIAHRAVFHECVALRGPHTAGF